MFPPNPFAGKSRSGCLGGQGRGRRPHKVSHAAPALHSSWTLQCPQPQGQPGPATLLPGTKRGIEGHSGALSSPCLPGRGRLPSAGFSSLVLALQHPWELWYPRDMGHPRELAPAAAALEPYPSLGDPMAVPTRVPFPHGGQGAGESGHRITSVRGKTAPVWSTQGQKHVPGMKDPTGRCWGDWEGDRGSSLLSHGADVPHCHSGQPGANTAQSGPGAPQSYQQGDPP